MLRGYRPKYVQYQYIANLTGCILAYPTPSFTSPFRPTCLHPLRSRFTPSEPLPRYPNTLVYLMHADADGGDPHQNLPPAPETYGASRLQPTGGSCAADCSHPHSCPLYKFLAMPL
jgi:hypothetical protein